VKRLQTTSRGLGWRFRKSEEGPLNNRLASDFNVEIEGVNVEVVKHLKSQNSISLAQVFLMVPFRAINLLIEESNNVKGVNVATVLAYLEIFHRPYRPKPLPLGRKLNTTSADGTALLSENGFGIS
jgi:hypothetical protein